jgi:hypothetical protein
MGLSADNIIEIIKNETLGLVENTLEKLDNMEQLSKMLTVMNSESREKFTIQGSGDDVVTLQPASGEPHFDVSKEEFQKNYVLPKDAADEDDDQLHGDKEIGTEENVDESIPNLKTLVREAMGL